METDLAMAEGDYLLLVWFFNLPPEIRNEEDGMGGDMMGFVIRPGGSFLADWEVHWRFRYYRDAKAWHSRDRKQWYGRTFPPLPEREVERRVREVIDLMIVGAAGEFRASIDPEIFYVRGDAHKLDQLVTAGQTPKWMHGREVGR